MNQKIITIVAVSAAVIAAAAAAIVVSVNRSNEARAYAEAEASAADKAEAEAKKTAKDAEIESAKERTAKANEKAKADELAAQKLASASAEAEAKAAAERKSEAESVAAAENAKAEAARAAREEAKAKAETARMEEAKAKAAAAEEEAKAEAEAARLAIKKLEDDKVIAEKEALELRKIDFETIEQNLQDWKAELEERERALQPEKTVADLTWIGGNEDTVVDEKGDVHKLAKTKYLPERDRTLPSGTRLLAKENRLFQEAATARAASVRTNLVGTLEALYVQSLKSGRVVDANFYKKSIKSMYPDWEFKLDEKKVTK